MFPNGLHGLNLFLTCPPSFSFGAVTWHCTCSAVVLIRDHISDYGACTHSPIYLWSSHILIILLTGSLHGASWYANHGLYSHLISSGGTHPSVVMLENTSVSKTLHPLILSKDQIPHVLVAASNSWPHACKEAVLATETSTNPSSIFFFFSKTNY